MNQTINGFPAEAPDFKDYDKHTVEEVFRRLECKDPLTRQFIRVVLHGIRVFDVKQRMYGESNIADEGAIGVKTRMGDKLARIRNMMAKGEVNKREPIEDTFGDIANYGFIGLMCRWKLWPGSPEQKKAEGQAA